MKNNLRIIAGKFKGYILITSNCQTTQPTSDLIKGSVFNSLFTIKGKVLDLFCGFGSYGFESLSRGAEYVIFNDINKIPLQSINKNISELSLDKQTTIYQLDYNILVNTLIKDNWTFEYIFLDPPYELCLSLNTLQHISQLLAKDGILIYEHHKNTIIHHPENLFLYKEKKQGIKCVSFFRKNDKIIS